MSNNKENRRNGGAPLNGCIAGNLPGWPLEWVSSKGRYGGKVESLVLVHFSCTSIERDPSQKTLLLTARDRRRRAWSTTLVMEDGPVLDAIEAALSRSLYSRLADVGATKLSEGRDEAPARDIRGGVLIPLPVERKRLPLPQADTGDSPARRSGATR